MRAFYSLISNQTKDSFILTTTNYQLSHYKKPPKHPPHPLLPVLLKKTNPTTRNKTTLGTDNYKRSLRRSFSRAKLLAFFNTDLTHFITLTYSGTTHTPEDVQKHIKLLIKKQKRNYSQSGGPKNNNLTNNTVETTKTHESLSVNVANTKSQTLSEKANTKQKSHRRTEEVHRNKANTFKYIYVMEYQKRGSIHVHMICNNWLEYDSLRVGKLSVKLWDKGFSDVRTIESFDSNFKPYLYLFKYMHKTERIGSSFIHTSRNIDKTIQLDYRDYIDKLKRGNVFYKEDYEFLLNERKARITKEYYKTPQKNIVGEEERL